MIALSTYLKQYKVGDIVDVVANGAVQKGMVRQMQGPARTCQKHGHDH
jgi:ribosomal protein L21E